MIVTEKVEGKVSHTVISGSTSRSRSKNFSLPARCEYFRLRIFNHWAAVKNAGRELTTPQVHGAGTQSADQYLQREFTKDGHLVFGY